MSVDGRIRWSDSAEAACAAAPTASVNGADTNWIRTPVNPGAPISVADRPISSLLFASMSCVRWTSDGRNAR